MCFGSKADSSSGPAPRPAQSQPNHHSSNNMSSSSGKQQQQEYAPPAGPPPGRTDYAPPAGPPPGKTDDYAPPPGPPPSKKDFDDWAKPPSGPPPSGKGHHDWEAAVPDTSLFPPPPDIFSGYDASHTSNATEAEAEAGEDWCKKYPMTMPGDLDEAGKAALQNFNIRMIEPVGYNGTMKWLGNGMWEASTVKKSPDRCAISYPPLYSVNLHDPTRTGKPKTVYYEFRLLRDSPTPFLAVGFSALPYPSFRMPGWHRGSLAVHGDDGHKYINDRWGGKDFTQAFDKGVIYGIGMSFSPSGSHKPKVEIFFTRDGQKIGGWELHEETDSEQDLPVTGLEGFHDLAASIGTYDGVKYQVIFDPERWLYKPLNV